MYAQSRTNACNVNESPPKSHLMIFEHLNETPLLFFVQIYSNDNLKSLIFTDIGICEMLRQ